MNKDRQIESEEEYKVTVMQLEKFRESKKELEMRKDESKFSNTAQIQIESMINHLSKLIENYLSTKKKD